MYKYCHSKSTIIFLLITILKKIISKGIEIYGLPSRRATMRATENEEDSMIAIGENAPNFNLKDQFGRDVTLGQFKSRRHVMLLFYPLDFTPT